MEVNKSYTNGELAKIWFDIVAPRSGPNYELFMRHRKEIENCSQNISEFQKQNKDLKDLKMNVGEKTEKVLTVLIKDGPEPASKLVYEMRGGNSYRDKYLDYYSGESSGNPSLENTDLTGEIVEGIPGIDF